MYELTDLDVEILKFIASKKSVRLEAIKKEFPNIEQIEFRLKQLATPEYMTTSHRIKLPIENTSYISTEKSSAKGGSPESDTMRYYHVTKLGHKVLQDRVHAAKNAKKELWLKNAWIPICVSFITTVITNYLLPKLPQMLEWLSHTLSRILSQT